MTPSDSVVQVRPLSAEDGAAIMDLDQWAFGFDDEGLDHQPLLDGFEWDRCFGAYLAHGPDASGPFIGTTVTYSTELSVPGGHMPCAALTFVGVHPQHRRRGVLRTMMSHHLQAVRERGTEPVSALYAAEPAIYGRFGYGLATMQMTLTLPRKAALREPTYQQPVVVRLERADADRHSDLVAAVYEQARTARPGGVSRPTRALQRLPLDDQAFVRKGAEKLRILVAESSTEGGGPARPLGYALFRRKSEWNDAGPDGRVVMREMAAVNAGAAYAIWQRLLDLDLTTSVVTCARPVDDPLMHMLVDVRAALPRVGDGVWVRLVDLPAALAGRRYSRDVDVVLGVQDALCPWNQRRWHLTGGASGATCDATERSADLVLDVREVGAALLGGQSLAALGAAGLVEERVDGALAAVAAAFASPLAPFCGWMF